MKRYEFRARAPQDDSRAELLIYGDIGESWYEDESNDAKTVVKEISKARNKPIDVRINSYGGAVSDGLAIFNALRRHDGETIAHIDGVAYSIASLIAMGADRIHMAANSLMMVHAPWGINVGNAEAMRKAADTLDVTAEAMKSAYIRPGGPDAQLIDKWLTDGEDHYFPANEAAELGPVDEVTNAVKIAAALQTALPKNYRWPEAQASSQSPQQEAAMADKNDAQGGSSEYMQTHAQAVKAGVDKGAQAENARIRAITEAFNGFASDDPTDPIRALREQCLGDIKCSVDEANRRILLAMRERTDIPIDTGLTGVQPIGGGVYAGSRPAPVARPAPGADQIDKFVEGATKAILIRSGMERDQKVIAQERSGEYLSMNLTDMCKESLRVAGLPVNGSSQDIIRRVLAAGGPGQGTDHFPAILENIANKSVMDGFMGAEETWQRWTVPGTLQDYREASRVNKSLFDTLDKMEEFEAFQHGRFADVKQAIQGFLYGKAFSLTLQSIVNDDLSILTGDAMSWGEAANVTIGDAVFTSISATQTGGFGTLMSETGLATFHATHGNYIASGSGAAPSAATIGAGRTAMLTQTDPNSRTVANAPRFLLHPTTLTMTVFPLLNSQNLITGADGTLPERNAVQSVGLKSVEEYRMDSWVSTAWILAAVRRTVEVAFVGGQNTPRVDRMPSGEIPGITWQISIPFGVTPLDYRTFYLNYGA